MSEAVKVHFESIPINEEAPPDYSNPNYETPSDEPNVVMPVQSGPEPIVLKPSRYDMIKKYFPIFVAGFVFCLLVVFVSNALRKVDTNSTPVSDNGNSKCDKRLIGYYSGWDNRMISEKQIEKLTHIIFNGINVKEDGRVQFMDDETRLSFLDMKNKARNMKSDVKIMFSTDNYSHDHVTKVMMDSKTRKEWVDSISAFILEQQIDGVQLYYRWPDTEEEKENYVFFVRELKYKFEKMERLTRRKIPYIISVVPPYSDWPAEGEVILHELLDYADFLNIETNNYYGPWKMSSSTGPFGPLYSKNDNKSIDGTMNAYACKTNMPNRLNFMISFRGVQWENVHDRLTSMDPVYKNTEKVVSPRYSDPWRTFTAKGYNLTLTSWHNVSKTPYIWDSENRKLFTFENERSLVEKMKYAKDKNIGGVIFDSIEFDDDSNTLLNAVTTVGLCFGERYMKDEIRYECGSVKSEKMLFSYNFSHTQFNFLSMFVFLLLCFL